MNPDTRNPNDQTDTIRELCQKSLREPTDIWDALQSTGIQVTPGVIYQTISDLCKSPKPRSDPNPKNTPDEAAPGLSMHDLEVVASMAEKAGGVRP